MIKIEVTVAEAIGIANTAGNDLHDRIVKAIELAMGVNTSCNVTITKMGYNERLHCIKTIRNATGWGLKEAKDWVDVISGYKNAYGDWVDGGKKNTVTLATPSAAESLLRDLTGYGCVGYLS